MQKNFFKLLNKKNKTDIIKIVLLMLIFLNSSILVYLERFRISDKLAKITSQDYSEYGEKVKDRNVSLRILDGGYILFFRHGERYKAEPHQALQTYDAYELNKNIKAENSYFKKFVCLNEEGKAQAKFIGEVFNDLKVPVGKVISSPSCRARQTANIAFGKIDVIHNTLVHKSPWFEKDSDFYSNVKEVLLKHKPEKGKNIIVTAHNSVLERDVFDEVFQENLRYGIQEGGFYVIKQEGEKLVLIHKFKSFLNFSGSMYIRPLDK